MDIHSCIFFFTLQCNGIYQSTVFGTVAVLPPKYTGSVVLGANICGCFATVISILYTSLFTSKRTSAIFYFVTAIIVLLGCVGTYFALPFNQFFMHYKTISKNNEKSSESKTGSNISYWTIFKQAFPQLLNVFSIFFVTLSVFPAIHSDIKRSPDFPIEEEYYTLITCFLTFNVFAMLGSLTTTWIQWPPPGFLVIPVMLRIVFLPLMLFCNYQPKTVERTMPVLIYNDWIYWIIAIVMAYSSGYLSSLGMMYTPQTVDSENQIIAGMFAAACLVTGIFCGVLFSYFGPIFVQL